MELSATLSALADQNRRAVIDLLKEQPRRAGEIAVALSLTPPARSVDTAGKRGDPHNESQGMDAKI